MFHETLTVKSVDVTDILKLRPSVAVVVKDHFTEFFLTDIRKSISLQMAPDTAKMLFGLNGEVKVGGWMERNNIPFEQKDNVFALLEYLLKSNVLVHVDEEYEKSYKTYPRVFSFLENFYSSHSEINAVFKKLQRSVVMIIGLGSVGTWIAKCLSMDAVRHFIFVDNDRVELSNLHRQVGFTEASIGKYKTDAFREFILSADEDADIETIRDVLDDSFFLRHDFGHIDLIIDCADYPSVDVTSRIVGEYAMPRGIAHSIGGGYNLHQTLIGQIVIPGKTACLECFRKDLDDINEIDTSNITKLENRNRKPGSFPPLSALSASISANEAFKYLTGIGHFTMTNSRVEFSLRDLNFHRIEMKRRSDCKWCGHHGKYYQL
mgnify:FL=1